MSFAGFAAPLDIGIRPSRLLGVLLIAAHGGAIGSVAVTALPLWLRAAFVIATLASLHRGLFRYALLRDSRAIVGVRCDAGNRWLAQLRSGESIAMTLLPTSCVHPLAVVLNLRSDTGIHSAILLRDNTDPDAFRRLRVRLLVARQEFAAAADPASGPGA